MRTLRARGFGQKRANRIAVRSGGVPTPTPSVPQYLGQVATRTRIPGFKDATNTQAMTRTYHYARDTISSLQIIVPGFYCTGASIAETALTGAPTVAASIEYPAGTFTQILFGGVATGTVPNGLTLTSDATTVAIPSGAKFWVLLSLQQAGGIPIVAKANDTANGDAVELAVSGLTNKTMSGTVSSAETFYNLPPLAIIAQTTKLSVYAVGDSRIERSHDDYNAGGGLGEICRSVDASYAYIDDGVSGDRALDWLVNGANRKALASYCSHAIVGFGINDLIRGAADSTVYSYLRQIHGELISRGCKVAQITCSPYTPASAGSTAWATTGTQVADSTVSPKVASLNTTLRTTSSHPDVTIFDTAAVVASGDLWIGGYTDDGLHAVAAGCQAIQDSGVINVANIAPAAHVLADGATTYLTHGFFGVDSATVGGAADTGQTETQIGGTWGRNLNRLYYSGSATTTGLNVDWWDAGQANIQMSARVVLPNGGYDTLVIFRATDINNFLFVEIAASTITLFKRIGGTYTALGSAYSASSNFLIRLIEIVANGTSITVYVDGVSRITFTGTTGQEAATKVGFGALTSAGTTNQGSVLFDNLKVTSVT